MKRRICSYDRVEVPEAAFILQDKVGDVYFCNLRCFLHMSRADCDEAEAQRYRQRRRIVLKTPEGQEHRFSGIIQVAMWATLNALKI
jgi:hypothetical protein